MTELRLPRIDDVDLISAWHTDPAAGGEFQWAGFRSSVPLRERIINGEIITDDGGQLVIVDGTATVGDVSWHRLRTGATPWSWCWSIGIIVVAEHRGRGYGSEAQRLLAEYLFAHTTANRLQADTEITNLAEQRALEKAGFRREGVMRGASWRGGAWRDMVLFARLRDDE